MLLLQKCCLHQINNQNFNPLSLLINSGTIQRFLKSRPHRVFALGIGNTDTERKRMICPCRRDHYTYTLPLCKNTHFLSHKVPGTSISNSRLSSQQHTASIPIYLPSCRTLFHLSHESKREFSERRIMGYSMEQMFNVVSDVENYNQFLPWCESSKVLQRTNNLIIADLIIGMKPVTESYTSKVTLRKPQLIQAVSTKGRYFKNMYTTWKFSPGLKAKPQSTCIIDFYVSLEFLSVLHANVANVFFNEVVKAMAGAFYSEAKRRYGPESVPSRKITILKSDISKKGPHQEDDL